MTPTPQRPTPAPLTARATAVQAANRATLVRREAERRILNRATATKR